MKKYSKKAGRRRDPLSQINKILQGEIENRRGEKILKFKNHLGKGKIIALDCQSGLTTLNFNVKFNTEVELSFDFIDHNTVQFIFVTKGNLKHCNFFRSNEQCHELNRFQNIIISAEKESTNSFVFRSDVKTKANIIFASKSLNYFKNSDSEIGVDTDLDKLFKENNSEYNDHYGNYSLKIGDLVTLYSNLDHRGVIKSLASEGYISLILASQLEEYRNYENSELLPESLTKTDVSKIKMLALYISENITEDLSLKNLSKEVAISKRKMQLGFRLLFSKSVNEYVRTKKLEFAAGYIENSDLSISEIVYKIGYNSRSYFSKIFYEHYGILPIDYKLLKRRNDLVIKS